MDTTVFTDYVWIFQSIIFLSSTNINSNISPLFFEAIITENIVQELWEMVQQKTQVCYTFKQYKPLAR